MRGPGGGRQRLSTHGDAGNAAEEEGSDTGSNARRPRKTTHEAEAAKAPATAQTAAANANADHTGHIGVLEQIVDTQGKQYERPLPSASAMAALKMTKPFTCHLRALAATAHPSRTPRWRAEVGDICIDLP